jgi:hypothetical protein
MLEEVMGMIASNTLAFDSLIVQSKEPTKSNQVCQDLGLSRRNYSWHTMLTFLNFDPKCSDTAIANISLRQRHFYLDNDNGKLDHS